MARSFDALLAQGCSGRLALALPRAFRPAEPPRRIPRRSPFLAGLRALGLALLLLHAAYILATSLLILCFRVSSPSATVLMAYRKWGYGWKLSAPRPLPLRAVPPYVRSMLISVEDGKFYDHHGFDLDAFKRAYEVNARLKRPLYGGSTLTMQLARTLFLVPEKSYLRKYLEIIAALELELFLSKERILELYFGYAEWGKGLFGIEAAARHYYGKGVAALSREQSARLIALLSSPIKYGPKTLEKSAILRERYSYLLRRYVGARPMTEQAVLPKIPAAESSPTAAEPTSPEPPSAPDSEDAREAGPAAAESESQETLPPLPPDAAPEGPEAPDTPR